MLKRYPRKRGTRIKSIQRGTITLAPTETSQTATITAVDTAKAELNFLGNTQDADSTGTFSTGAFVYLELTNSTTVTASRPVNSAGTVVVGFEVIEYANALPGQSIRVKSIQRGTITLASAASATATITAVDTVKSSLRWLGQAGVSGTVTTAARMFQRLEFTNSTTITGFRIATTGTVMVAFEVVEYENVNVA